MINLEQYQGDSSVMRRFVGLLMAPPSASRLEKLLPPELHHAARSTYFLLDTEHDTENFITYTLSRLIQRLNRDTRQATVVYQGRVRGRVIWPATLKAHYGEDYNPSRYVCREVRRRYDTPENQLLKHLLERLDQCLKTVPEVVRAGICCYSSGRELRQFSENIADRLDRMERAVTAALRHVALAEVGSLQTVLEWHLVQAETARIDEYVEVARFFKRYKKAVMSKRWGTTFDTGKRMLPLPGRLDANGDQWLQFAISIFRNNSTKEYKAMTRRFHFNGLNGSTGSPLIPAMSADELIEWLKADDQNEDKAIKDAARIRRDERKAKLGLIEGINPLDLTNAKWGIVYPTDISQTVKAALLPLVNARNGIEVTYNPKKTAKGETATEFRKRFKQTPGKTDPNKLPYYLLLVGSPEQIPFKFQYSLDADHAVGRLYFDDEADYAKYVTNLLAYEKKPKTARKRLLSIFSPANSDDESTTLSAMSLAKPLATELDQKELEVTPGTNIKYGVEHLSGANATKQALVQLLTRQDNQPAVLFTATHALGFELKDSRQSDEQGALVCQDWPGPKKWQPKTPLTDNMIFGGNHITADTSIDGLIVFAFGCYTAGTPKFEDFSYFKKVKPKELSAKPFISKLPQKLLAAGAIGFVGHVDKAWDYSFVFSGIGGDVSTFQSTLESILKGNPIGHALEHFNDRYLGLARELTESEEDGMLHQFNLGEPVDPLELVSLWTAHNDARAYVLLGDPFARLNVDLLDPA